MGGLHCPHVASSSTWAQAPCVVKDALILLVVFFFFFWVKAFLSFSERRNRSIVGGEVEACSVGKKAEGELWSCNGPSEESGVPQSLAVRLCLVRESTREMTKEEKVNVSEAGGLTFAVSQSTKSSTAAGFPPSSAPGLSETCR